MENILQHVPSPGADFAVVVGRPVPGLETMLADIEAILWMIDSDACNASVNGASVQENEWVEVDKASNAEVASRLEKYMLRDGSRLPHIIVTTGLPEAFTPNYIQAIDLVRTIFERTYRARLTRQEEGALWQKHLLQNVPDYMERRLPGAWQNALKGVPAYVCGAGPSLDVTAGLLAANGGNAAVIAADSALRCLGRHGVQADFAVSVDASKVPEKCLDTSTKPRFAVLASISPPAWRKHFSDRFCFLSGRQVTEDWLADSGIPKTSLLVRENCGITALGLARYLGCSPIYLLGMDMAADAGNHQRRHNGEADASIHRGQHYRTDGAMSAVPGNYSETVPTFMYSEWVALNEILASWPAGLVFNVNDRGARIENTTVIHPDEFRGIEGGRPARAMDDLSVSPFDGTTREQVKTAARLIGHEGMRGAYLCANLRDKLDAGDIDAVKAGLCQFFGSGDFARIMGAFSLKLMPHLTARAKGDLALWQQLVEELDELCRLSSSVGVAYNVDSSRASA